MTTEELRAKAHKAWKTYCKEPDKKRKAEFCDAFKEARAEFLAAKERFKTVNGRRSVMNDSTTLAKIFGYSVAALLLTGFMLCVVIYCHTSSLLSFVIGGVTFSTWFSLIELIAAYLEERHEKFH